MKRILMGLVLIATIGTSAFGLTASFFSDREQSQNNDLRGGKVDLLIDNTSYYNGVLNTGTTWERDDLPGHLFFDFNDIKPSDQGEDTISIHVDNNNAWACAQIALTKNDDVSCTEPELLDDNTCSEPDGDLLDGELAQNINMVFWVDDGDNVLEDNEATGAGILAQGKAEDVLDDTKFTLADSTKNIFGGTGPLLGGKDYFIGKAWCFGALTLVPLLQDGSGNLISPANTTGGIGCDGSNLNNATQTDAVMADLSFSATQERNNRNFLCEGSPSPSPSASPSPTPSPTPQACSQADVMMVLDRSGSISSSELALLKTAAKSFVDSLGLTPTGIHAGFSSFTTTATLNQHLTSNSLIVKNAIDVLLSSGFTNLKAGIDLSKVELDTPGDGHDRADVSSPDKMIVITDGHPNRPLPSDTADDVAATSADAARAAGVEVFVVGVGSDVDATYLQNEIADNPGHYFSALDYSGLQTILQNLDLCDE